MALKLHLDILPETQRKLWPRLSQVPETFILYGGTAIALQLGHRHSLDFDFFTFSPFSADDLLDRVSFLSSAKVMQQAPNTLSVMVATSDMKEEVKVSFFGLPRLKRLNPPHVDAKTGVRLADLLDLAGMKMATLPRRVEAKDHIDMHAILTRTAITLEQALAAATCIYDNRLSPYDSLKALVWFDDPGLEAVTPGMRRDLEKHVARFDPERFRQWQVTLRKRLKEHD